MNHSQFLDLCRDISTELNLDDLDELGFSNYLEIDDINTHMDMIIQRKQRTIMW